MEKPTLVLPLQFPSAFGTDFAPVAPPVREDGERKPARLFAGGIPPKQASKTPYTAHLLIDPAKLIVCGRVRHNISCQMHENGECVGDIAVKGYFRALTGNLSQTLFRVDEFNQECNVSTNNMVIWIS